MAAMRATGAAAVAAAFAAAIACAVLYQMADGQAKQDSECRCNEEGYHKTAPFIGGDYAFAAAERRRSSAVRFGSGRNNRKSSNARMMMAAAEPMVKPAPEKSRLNW